MTAFKNLTGIYFGRLLVLHQDKTKTNRTYWRCKCTCGNLCTVATYKLTSKTTQSCGCLRKEINHRKNNDDKATSVRILYRRYKNDAKIRNKSFELSVEDFEKFLVENCFYCGAVPQKQVQRRNRNDKFRVYDFKYNGIDRKDNAKGYFVDNCVTCCSVCNRAKDTMSLTEFLSWVADISRHWSL